MAGNGQTGQPGLAGDVTDAPRQPLLTVYRPLVTLPPAIADRETGDEDRASVGASRFPCGCDARQTGRAP